jgi:acyl-CoA thioesterase-2
MRDGKSFTTRRVTARQHGHPIFSMLVSFHADEPGLAHQATMPEVPPPEQLPSEANMREKILPTMPDPVRRYYERERPIELRPVEFERYLGKKFPDGKFNLWFKTTGRLPDDPAIHQCVLAYASDMGLLDAALVPHGRTLFEKDIMAASLDHAMWLHQPLRRRLTSMRRIRPTCTVARLLALHIHARRHLVASVAQEAWCAARNLRAL